MNAGARLSKPRNDRALAASLALLVLTAAAGAGGQTSRVWVNRSDHTRYTPEKSDRRALEILHRSARCVVERNRGASENLVFAAPESEDDFRLIDGPIRNRLDQCAGSWIQLSSLLLRG